MASFRFSVWVFYGIPSPTVTCYRGNKILRFRAPLHFNMMLREIGLVLFLASVIRPAPDSNELTGRRPQYVYTGFLITVSHPHHGYHCPFEYKVQLFHHHGHDCVDQLLSCVPVEHVPAHLHSPNRCPLLRRINKGQGRLRQPVVVLVTVSEPPFSQYFVKSTPEPVHLRHVRGNSCCRGVVA